MAHLFQWKVVCEVCGELLTYKDNTPIECPVNPVHPIGEVTQMCEILDEIIMHSPTKLWSITIDDTGTLVIVEI